VHTHCGWLTYGTSHPEGKYNEKTMIPVLWDDAVISAVVLIQASPPAL